MAKLKGTGLTEKKRTILLNNIIAGLGWMTGATFGFALLITLISLIFKWLGGLPFIGEFVANIIDVTNQALRTKGTITR